MIKSRDIVSAHEIVPKLWVGNMAAALDKDFLKKNNIKAIVNATPDVETPFSDIEYFRVPVEDTLKEKDFQDMIKHLPSAIKFIHDKLSKNKTVLVHCVAGINRSCTVVCAYISFSEGLTVNQAISHIISKRPIAFNKGKSVNFQKSLLYYCK